MTPDKRTKVAVIGVWLVIMVVACVAVLRHRHPMAVATTPSGTPRLQHPNIDGVAPGMAADNPAVQHLLSMRKLRNPPPKAYKDVTVDLQDGTTVYYNTYGQVGGLEGSVLRDGDQVVVQVGDSIQEIQNKLGRPSREMLVGSPRSLVYELSPGLCTQLFFTTADKLSGLNLYVVNPLPPGQAASAVPRGSP